MMTNVGNTIYVGAATPTSDRRRRVQRYDPATGTIGLVAGAPTAIVEMFGYDGTLYLNAQPTGVATGTELYSYDPATDATTLVVDVLAGSRSGSPSRMFGYGGKLAFQANAPFGASSTQPRVFVYDIAAGTLTDIFGGALSDRAISRVSPFAEHDGTLYFPARTPGVFDIELMSYDGTGTATLASDIYPGTADSRPTGLHAFDGQLFARITNNNQIAVVDLSGGTVRRDEDVFTFEDEGEPETSFSSSAAEFTPIGNELYMSASVDNGIGSELYVYEAATDTARLVVDLFAGSAGSNPGNLIELGGALYFTARATGSRTNTLHRLTPASGAAQELSPLTVQSSLIVSGTDRIYFEAPDGNRKLLYVYDVTSGATSVAVTQQRFSDTSVFGSVTLGDTLYYVRGNRFNSNDAQLFAIDDAAQTAAAKTQRATASRIAGLVAYDGMLYFAANQPNLTETDGMELYRYDPATGSVTLAADISAGTEGSEPQSLTVVGTSLYFTATTPATGRELYRYDAATGTVTRLSDLTSGSGDSILGALYADGTTLYFSARGDDGLGYELWQYDTTQLVSSIRPAGTLDAALRLFPNPTRESATLTIEQAMGEHVTIDLHDALGRRVARIHDGEIASPDARFDVPTDGLSAGLYFVVARGPSGTRTQSLTVVR